MQDRNQEKEELKTGCGNVKMERKWWHPFKSELRFGTTWFWRCNLKSQIRKIISRCVSVSIVLWRFISLCLSKGINLFSYCFSLFSDLLERMVANKLRTKRKKQTEFCVFVTLSHGEVTTGSDRNLRSSVTFIDTKETWYKCLYSAVALQQFQEKRYSASVYEV